MLQAVAFSSIRLVRMDRTWGGGGERGGPEGGGGGRNELFRELHMAQGPTQGLSV
jgi:hypothetical protein